MTFIDAEKYASLTNSPAYEAANFTAVLYNKEAITELSKGASSFEDILTAIPRIHAAYMSCLTAGATPAKAKAELVPAVPVKKSVTPDYIICLEDGKKFKSMRRHLSKLGMTPEQYREKWGLPSDYPIVAASYSAKRSQMAKDNGLGKKK